MDGWLRREINPNASSSARYEARTTHRVFRHARAAQQSFDYELFNRNNINIHSWSWNYRGCPEYLLSVERRPFHSESAGSLGPAFTSARPISLTVKLTYTLTLYVRLPTALSEPLRSSVTFLEETAPVKLPA